MKEQFSRTAALLGEYSTEKLAQSRVAVFGLGGVGSYVAEALARAGVGALDLIDSDAVALSNINRQLIALHSTVGVPKVRAAAARIKDINPECEVTAREIFFLPETAGEFDFSQYDYIADAVDTVTAKLALVCAANAAGVPIISCMGTGN
ncbi:MAG: ThiF family adenylyltransferase, partial [Clostridia bacterium]|nr:ThiF family adenylyltransferase [Clostridia bacterium]